MSEHGYLCDICHATVDDHIDAGHGFRSIDRERAKLAAAELERDAAKSEVVQLRADFAQLAEQATRREAAALAKVAELEARLAPLAIEQGKPPGWFAKLLGEAMTRDAAAKRKVGDLVRIAELRDGGMEIRLENVPADPAGGSLDELVAFAKEHRLHVGFDHRSASGHPSPLDYWTVTFNVVGKPETFQHVTGASIYEAIDKMVASFRTRH